jgi:hypothetical protein
VQKSGAERSACRPLRRLRMGAGRWILTTGFQYAGPHARHRLKSENGRVDRGFEAPVDRQIGAVDPARAVRAQKEDRGRDIGRRARAADAESDAQLPCKVWSFMTNGGLNDPYSANFMAPSRATRF